MDKLCPHLSGVDLDGNLIPIPCQEHRCEAYENVIGVDPQTGVEINQWGCSLFSSRNRLIIENSQQQRYTGAAVDKLTNTTVAASEAMTVLLVSQQKPDSKLIESE